MKIGHLRKGLRDTGPLNEVIVTGMSGARPAGSNSHPQEGNDMKHYSGAIAEGSFPHRRAKSFSDTVRPQGIGHRRTSTVQRVVKAIAMLQEEPD